MDLFEYQARELFAKHGVPVLKGIVATTPEEAKAAAEEIGGLTVIKAQVKTGGRGKAGGVKLAKSPKKLTSTLRQFSAWTSRATPFTACWSLTAQTSPKNTTSPSCWTVQTAPTWQCAR